MIAEIVTRLKSSAPSLATVAGTADLAMLVAGAMRHALPAAYVHPVRDVAAANTVIGAVSQRLTHSIGVLLVTAATGAKRGRDLPDSIESLVAELRTALLGFPPTSAHEPLELARGEMMRIASGTAWWLEVYTTASLERA